MIRSMAPGDGVVRRAVAVAAFAIASSSLAACVASEPDDVALESTTTSSTTTTTTAATTTSIPLDVECGTELPFFPTTVENADGTFDTDGTPGVAPTADPAGVDQLVRHWPGDDDVVFEMRWPPGSGPDIDSPIAVTQLIERSGEVPCNVVRVSAYGPEEAAAEQFPEFIRGLEGIDAKADFVADTLDRITPATATEPGECAEPAIVTPESDRSEIMEALLSNYAKDRTEGVGFEECFTVAGLVRLRETLDTAGTPDVVRSSSLDGTDHVEALSSFLGTDPLVVLRERLTVVGIPTPEGERLLFADIEIRPDSLVGEDEAIAYIDEFLLRMADGDFEAAAGYFGGDRASADVLAAMPELFADPEAALRRYCLRALCANDYKIDESIDFDANTRLVDVTFFDDEGSVEWPMRVGVVDGELMVMTPPPTSR